LEFAHKVCSVFGVKSGNQGVQLALYALPLGRGSLIGQQGGRKAGRGFKGPGLESVEKKLLLVISSKI